MTLYDFLSKHDFVLANGVEKLLKSYEYEIIGNDYDVETDSYKDIFQYFITGMSYESAIDYANEFNLLFLYIEELDLIVFCNNICIGMSFKDIKLEKVEVGA